MNLRMKLVLMMVALLTVIFSIIYFVMLSQANPNVGLYIVLSFSAIALVATSLYIMLGNLTKAISDLTEAMEKVTHRDFSLQGQEVAKQYIKREDEIGRLAQAVIAMQDSFHELADKVSKSAEQLASSAEEMTAKFQHMTTTVGQSARTIEEISGSIHEQAKDTEQGAQIVTDFGELIEQEQKLVARLSRFANNMMRIKNQGEEAFHELVKKAEEANQSTVQVYKVIEKNNANAQKIAEASQMIGNIAEQTNLLALNAAIEAARAGEAGRGFTVVAEEIRKLADQSNLFSREIEKVLAELIKESQKAVQVIEAASHLVEEQNESIDITEKKFAGMAGAITKVREMSETIEKTGQEMDKKKDQIIEVLANLTAIAEENSANIEEASSSVEEQRVSMQEIATASDNLVQRAETMNALLKQMKV
ncbi:HAMP domain-containing protein [Heliorestis acidaminivorans]|uniref:HAMP domain-containing protein n=1 Tax=Heliorestis acidaminivorans TaxID=553427 RepID=A0A6I0F7B5_9FIRM|nr:methyl-accepting chemotaxis protein [Heliorestis acidaminivorans]KAB2953273.1 HAMP domain-containing protein [Heliorestis acidaminivorans]